MFLLVMILGACRDANRHTGSPVSDSGSPEGNDLSTVLGCNPDLEIFDSVEASSTSVTTVPRLTWTTGEPVRAYVVTDVGRETLLESSVPDAESTEGETLVLGIPYLRESWTVVAAQTEQGLACSEPIYLAPATLSTAIPELNLTASDPDQAQGGYTVTSLITETASFAAIIDEYGEYVWTHSLDPGFVSRASISNDGTSIQVLTWAHSVQAMGTITRFGFDGELIATTSITGLHTDVVELPDGAMAGIVWDLREFVDDEGNVRQMLGDALVELDSEGNERVVWSAFDSYTPDLSETYEAVTLGSKENLEDWTHGNGLSYDSDQDDYLISLFGLGAVIRLDRQSGEVQWVLSDSHGDFQSTNDDLLVQGTHSVEALSADQLLLFNRNVPNPLDEPRDDLEEICSEAVEIQLDLKTGEATKTWSYQSEDCVLVVFFGEAVRLENGNTMVIFSSSGQISESNPSGETVWQVNSDVGATYGFGERRTSLY